ncbi:MAG: hypothetical protein AAF605_04050 [Myxococcota bacterium]
MTLTSVGPVAAEPVAEEKLTIEEKSEASDLVVLGKVVKSTSYWKGKLIVTTSDVAIYDVIKGDVDSEEVQVTTVGGVVGDIRLRVTHSTALEEGELAILFLREPGEASFIEKGGKRVSVSEGKIPLLAPGFSEVRFRNDRRLQTRIESISEQITGG